MQLLTRLLSKISASLLERNEINGINILHSEDFNSVNRRFRPPRHASARKKSVKIHERRRRPKRDFGSYTRAFIRATRLSYKGESEFNASFCREIEAQKKNRGSLSL